LNEKLQERYRGRRWGYIGARWLWAIAAVVAAVLTWVLPRLLSADAVTKYLVPVSKVVSVPIKWLTGWLPFSLLEVILIALLPTFAYLVFVLFKKPEEELPEEGGILSSCLILIGVMLTIFNVVMGFSYSRTPLGQALMYDEAEVNAAMLRATVVTLAKEGAAAREQADFTGRTVRGYGRQLREEYAALSNTLPIYAGIAALPKRAILSVPMSYLGVGGMYSPFTCEAIVSDDTTPPSLAFTVAHEMAHSLGFSRENEANFSAFLVCMDSEDPTLRYSGCFMGLLYTLSAYYHADPDSYAELYDSIDEGIRLDIAEHSAYLEKYEGIIGDLHSKINDLFLKSNGEQEGVASYGQVVDLIVAWNEENK